jgi:polysaccharide biosynthesis protein PelA
MRLFLVSFIALLVASPAGAAFPWAVCYSGTALPAEFHNFHLVVLDSDTHPPLDLLKRDLLRGRERELLGYLSLGEVESHRSYFEAAQAEGLLLRENPGWHGSFYVDFRNPHWRRRVTEQLVPGILASGFNGIFLDTLDDAGELEHTNPQKYRGMIAAAVELVRGLRQAFPQIHIMVNRGYDVLPQIAPFIDIILGESVYTSYDVEHKGYVRVPAPQYHEQVRLMRQAQQWNPKLKICSLDYWDPSDIKEIRHIYQVERANGFAPYVATRELDRIVRAP